MLAFAMKVCNDSAAIGEADFAALRAHGFSDEDAWDIAGITALFGFSNRMANVTSMRPNDEFYLMGRVPKPAKAACLSRPGEAPLEHLFMRPRQRAPRRAGDSRLGGAPPARSALPRRR